MTDIYVAPKRHECDPPTYRNIGSVWRCDCGRYWYVFTDNGISSPAIAVWTPVRWWNWRIRKRIPNPHDDGYPGT